MEKCTNPEIGYMIGRYEFDQLSLEEKQQFEKHLLVCNYCFKEVYEFSPSVKNIQANKEEFIASLESEKTILNIFVSKISSFIYTIRSFITDYIFEKPKASIPVMTGISIAIICIIVFKIYLPSIQEPKSPQQIVLTDPASRDSKAAIDQYMNIYLETFTNENNIGLTLELNNDNKNILINWESIPQVNQYQIVVSDDSSKIFQTTQKETNEPAVFIAVQKLNIDQIYHVEILSQLKNNTLKKISKSFILKVQIEPNN